MSTFIVEFPLKTEPYEEYIINKRLEIARKMYNSLIHIVDRRYKEMVKTKKYRNLVRSLTKDKKKNKLIYKEIRILCEEYQLTEYSFHKDIKQLQKVFKDNINAHVSQKLASNLWRAYKKLIFGNGKEIHYKKYGQLNTLEGKNNQTGIVFKDDFIYFKDLVIPVVIDYNNPYEFEAVQNKVKYCRIVRKWIKNKYKYYVQLIFDGIPPIKFNKDTGEYKRFLGDGNVGIDIGTSTIAIVGKTEAKLIELADKVQNIEAKKRRLNRKLDRSRRATNLNNYNPDGTIKKQSNKKVKWNKSNHYKKYQGELRELYRKQSAIRKYQHEILANEILKLGNNFYVEKMNFKGLTKKSKDTKKNSKGRYKKKKRFGKTIANRAPSMLLDIIDRKLKYYDKELIKIETKEAKASQYNHFNNTYIKKKLSNRWNKFDKYIIQRDLYSAFLIMNINNDLKTFDTMKCNDRFEDFYKLHNDEINRLKELKEQGTKLLKSMGI